MLVDITNIHGLTKYILQVTNDETAAASFGYELDVNDYLQVMVEEIRGISKANISLETSDAPAFIKADRVLIKRFFRLVLVSLLVTVNPGSRISLRVEKSPATDADGDVDGIRIAIRTDSSTLLQDKEQDVIAIAEFQRKMLAAFFICFHHGGNIQIETVDNKSLNVDILLPFEPTTVIYDEEDDGWLGKIIELYENRMITNSRS